MVRGGDKGFCADPVPLARKERGDGTAIVRRRRDRGTTAKNSGFAIASSYSKRDTRCRVSLLLVGRGRFELPKS